MSSEHLTVQGREFLEHWFVFVKETLRTALALGADRAIHVEVTGKDYELLQPLAISKLIAAVAKKENVDLILLGKLVSLAGWEQVLPLAATDQQGRREPSGIHNRGSHAFKTELNSPDIAQTFSPARMEIDSGA